MSMTSFVAFLVNFEHMAHLALLLLHVILAGIKQKFSFLFKKTCVHLDLKRNWKYHTFCFVKGAFPLALSVKFCIINNFAELHLLAMMEFSFNTLPRWTLITSLVKCVSDFIADVFSPEKEVFSWTYLLRKTPRRTKILIFLVWN